MAGTFRSLDISRRSGFDQRIYARRTPGHQSIVDLGDVSSFLDAIHLSRERAKMVGLLRVEIKFSPRCGAIVVH